VTVIKTKRNEPEQSNPLKSFDVVDNNTSLHGPSNLIKNNSKVYSPKITVFRTALIDIKKEQKNLGKDLKT